MFSSIDLQEIQNPISLTYYANIEGASTNLLIQDSFQYSCFITFNFRDEHVIVEDCHVFKSSVYINTADAVKFAIDFLLERGLIQIYASGEKSYWSIGSLILEVWVVKVNGTTEYRDMKSGLLVGAESTFETIVRRVKYEVTLFVQLNSFEPTLYQNNLSIIQVPIEETRVLLIIFASIIVLSSTYVFLKWSEYRIV